MEPSSFPSIPRDRERGETLSIAGSRNKGVGDDAMNGRDGAKRRKGVFFLYGKIGEEWVARAHTE